MGFIFTSNNFGEIPYLTEAMKNSASYKLGLQAITEFHNQALKYGSNYPFKVVDELISFYGAKGPFLVDGIGYLMPQIDISLSEAQDIMKELAIQGAGKVPENWMSFNNALSNYAQNPGILKALTFTAAESWKEVEKPLSDLKEGTFTALSFSKYAMPILLWGGLGFLGYVWIKKSTVLADILAKSFKKD